MGAAEGPPALSYRPHSHKLLLFSNTLRPVQAEILCNPAPHDSFPVGTPPVNATEDTTMQPDPVAAMRRQPADMHTQRAFKDILSVVLTQCTLEDILSAVLAKATPARGAATRNKDTSLNKPPVGGPTPEDRPAAVRGVGTACPNCGSNHLFVAPGSRHIMCEECDCDLTECSR